MKIIAGLGNPGFRYRKTRHNAGFMVIDALSKKYGISVKKKGFKGIYGIGRIEAQEVLLFRPMTYMNLSGEAVKAVFSSKSADKSDLLVVSDDIDLPLGRIRIRGKGSSGGHNGLGSISEQIGSDFARLRLGVGRDDGIKGDAAGFVLSSFPRKERPELERVLLVAMECVEVWLRKGVKDAMNQYNA